MLTFFQQFYFIKSICISNYHQLELLAIYLDIVRLRTYDFVGMKIYDAGRLGGSGVTRHRYKYGYVPEFMVKPKGICDRPFEHPSYISSYVRFSYDIFIFIVSYTSLPFIFAIDKSIDALNDNFDLPLHTYPVSSTYKMFFFVFTKY